MRMGCCNVKDFFSFSSMKQHGCVKSIHVVENRLEG